MASDVIGVVLAGGLSRRFGSPKTLALFDGEPLIWRPLGALRDAVGNAVVVCKADTPLPELPDGVEVLHESVEGHHPAAGLLAAIDHAAGKRVAVLAGDMPYAGAELVRTLVEGGDGAVVASTADGLQPLAAVYPPSVRSAFAAALEEGRPLRGAVASLPGLVRVEVDPGQVASVNEPADLP